MHDDEVNGSIQPWRVISSRTTFEDRWLKVRSDECVSAQGRRIAPYHVLEYPDWVNVVAFTPDGRLLLVREYRHGRGEVLLGLVSGAIDDGDGPSPDAAERAARRELLEETGLSGAQFTPILKSYPNPANQTNLVTTFLVFDAFPKAEPSLDDSEAIEIVSEDLGGVLAKLRQGEIRMQAMHVAALWSAAAHILANGGDNEAASQLREKLLSALL